MNDRRLSRLRLAVSLATASFAPAVLAAALLAMGLLVPTGAARATSTDPDIVAKGEYLMRAGGCASCHKAEDGKPFAGGRVLPTPFGPLVSANITPDKETGIGAWTDDQFYRALHEGIRPDGAFLYPGFPYTSYTKMTRDDALAIKAYLFTQQPVHAAQKTNRLPFPFNIRESLLAWRQVNFHPGTFQPDPSKTADINRGAYLVLALGHCNECHTPRNVIGGSKTDEFLQGAEIQGWYAPNLTSDTKQGIGGWSEDELVSFLKTGATPGKGVAVGPMTEVVHDGLQYLTDDDIHAMARYLKSIPPAEKDTGTRVANATDLPGASVYLSYCATCHQPDGRGLPNRVPPLADNGAVIAPGPENVIKAVLGGFPSQSGYAMMPSFQADLSDKDIADVTNYVRTAWTKTPPPITDMSSVARLRSQTPGTLVGDHPTCPSASTSQAINDPKAGIGDLIAGVTSDNMVTQIDQMLSRIKSVDAKPDRSEVVNGLANAFCPVVSKAPGLTTDQKRQQFNRFVALVYSELMGPTQKSAQN